MSTKMIILKGAPACGKSTLARKLVEERSPAIIVNRDSIRDMCGKYWVQEREPLITELEVHAVTTALTSNYSVIIDATNLNPKTLSKWHRIAADLHIPIEEIVVELPLEEAIKRDKKRGEEGGRAVGEDVVRGFYKRYNL